MQSRPSHGLEQHYQRSNVSHQQQQQQQGHERLGAQLGVGAEPGAVAVGVIGGEHGGALEEEDGDRIVAEGVEMRRRCGDVVEGYGSVVMGQEADVGSMAESFDNNGDDVYYAEGEDEEVMDGEGDEDHDEDGDVMEGSGSAGMTGFVSSTAALTVPYLSAGSFTIEQHICVNCTRPFWGSVCRFCRHPAGTEVVVPELLQSAIKCVLVGQQQQQASIAQAIGGGGGGGVLLAYDDRCRAHLEEAHPGVSSDLGRSHPERPERVAAIMIRLHGSGLLSRCGVDRGSSIQPVSVPTSGYNPGVSVMDQASEWVTSRVPGVAYSVHRTTVAWPLPPYGPLSPTLPAVSSPPIPQQRAEHLSIVHGDLS